MERSFSKLIGSTGAIASSARTLKEEFLMRTRSMDLKTLIEEYVKTKDTIEQAKLTVKLELENIEKDLEEYVVKRLLEKASELPLNELLKLAKRAGVHNDILGRLPAEKVLNEISTLDLDNLVLVYEWTPALREHAFEELIKRFKTLPCNAIADLVIRMEHRFSKENVLKLLKNLNTRLDCAQVIQFLLTKVIRGHEHYQDDEVFKTFKDIVSNALKNFETLSCKQHMDLLEALAGSHHYMLLISWHEEAHKLLKEYADAISRNLDKCTIDDLVNNMFKSREPVHYYADKKVYTEGVLKLLVKSSSSIDYTTMTKIVDFLYQLSKDTHCLVLEKLGPSYILGMSKRALQSTFATRGSRISDSLLVASFARILNECRNLVSSELAKSFKGLCQDILGVRELGTRCIEDPGNTLELVECVYTLHLLSKDVLSAWCDRELEVPSVNLEKASGVIRRDLEKGVNPRSMRDAIRKLESVDEPLSRELMKLLDKHRRKLGITLKHSPW